MTGGARGLGLTIAQAILECGADVVAFDILPAPVEPEWSSALAAAKANGVNISYRQLNVVNEAEVALAFAQAFKSAREGFPVLGLLHCAGIQLLKEALDVGPEEFRRVVDVNLTGSFLVSQAFAREWMSANPTATGSATGPQASVVLIGSMSGHIANFGLDNAVYNASKAGVIQLGRNLALEWSNKGIRVNTLSPGYIVTAMTQGLFDARPWLPDMWTKSSLLGRLSTPDEFRGPAIFLLSSASSFMTGADMLVDGGHTSH